MKDNCNVLPCMFHLSNDIGSKDTLVGGERKQKTRSCSNLLPCTHGFHNVEGPKTGSSTDSTANVGFRYIGSEK